MLTSVNTDSGTTWVNLTAMREDWRDGDSASIIFLLDFILTYSCSWADFFGVAFLVAVEVSDLRLELTLVSDLIMSDLLNFSTLLLGVRAGDFERLRDGLLDFALLLVGDFDTLRCRCSNSTCHSNQTSAVQWDTKERTQQLINYPLLHDTDITIQTSLF